MNPIQTPGRLTPRQSAFYRKVIGIIDENLMSPNLTVSWLSQQAGLSRSQLFRRIHTITGQSVSRLIAERKIIHAKQLLNKSPITIEEIALKAGFKSTPYFSRCFKDHCGMTPTEYLKRQP